METESKAIEILEDEVVDAFVRDPLKDDDEQVLFIIRAELSHARRKYPIVPKDRIDAAGIVLVEAKKLFHAVLWEDKNKNPNEAEREALHVIATAVRFLTQS